MFNSKKSYLRFWGWLLTKLQGKNRLWETISARIPCFIQVKSECTHSKMFLFLLIQKCTIYKYTINYTCLSAAVFHNSSWPFDSNSRTFISWQLWLMLSSLHLVSLLHLREREADFIQFWVVVSYICRCLYGMFTSLKYVPPCLQEIVIGL